MDTKCEAKVLLKIALSIKDWRLLGNRLIGEKLVNDIAIERHNEQNRCETMLSRWLEKDGKEATYTHLVNVLQELGNKDTADGVTDLVVGKGKSQSRWNRVFLPSIEVLVY